MPAITLYRPVGQAELDLIAAAGTKPFLLGCRNSRGDVGWLGQVMVPDADELGRLAAGLREVRRAAYG